MINYGIVPLLFEDSADYERIDQGDRLTWKNLATILRSGQEFILFNETKGEEIPFKHDLSEREMETVLAGGAINEFRNRSAA
ncbi:MAG: hypothetical protein KDK33_10070, partial [Leptospiraceae bacterium]|nr:hypothetical protein [Leptospiraceae bacterium]